MSEFYGGNKLFPFIVDIVDHTIIVNINPNFELFISNSSNIDMYTKYAIEVINLLHKYFGCMVNESMKKEVEEVITMFNDKHDQQMSDWYMLKTNYLIRYGDNVYR